MALYGLNMEVRCKKHGSKHAWLPAPPSLTRTALLDSPLWFSSLTITLLVSKWGDLCGRGGGTQTSGPVPVTCQFVAVVPPVEDSAREVESVARVFTHSHVSLAAFAISVGEQTPPSGERVSLYPAVSWSRGLRLIDRPVRTCFLVWRSRR